MERQAIHGDADAMTFELSCEDFADKLAALIGVEDRRSATAGNRLLYILYAKNLHPWCWTGAMPALCGYAIR